MAGPLSYAPRSEPPLGVEAALDSGAAAPGARILEGPSMDRREQIRQYVIENFLFGDGSGLTDTQSLLRTGVLDSTGVMELIAHLEATYGITVEDTEVVPANLDSIENIVRFVGSKSPRRSDDMTPAS